MRLTTRALEINGSLHPIPRFDAIVSTPSQLQSIGRLRTNHAKAPSKPCGGSTQTKQRLRAKPPHASRRPSECPIRSASPPSGNFSESFHSAERNLSRERLRPFTPEPQTFRSTDPNPFTQSPGTCHFPEPQSSAQTHTPPTPTGTLSFYRRLLCSVYVLSRRFTCVPRVNKANYIKNSAGSGRSFLGVRGCYARNALMRKRGHGDAPSTT